MKNFVQIGDVLDYANASTAIHAGDVVVMTDRIGVAITDIPNGAVGAVRVRGVVDLPKKSTDNMPQGTAVYWSAGDTNITTTVGSNVAAGYVAATAGTSVARVRIVLNG